MLLRCSVVFCLFVAAQSALIKKRNIPVEIVYDKSNPSHYGNRNLDEKIQISQDDLLKFKLSEEIINERNEDNVDDISNEADGNPYGIRNLDAKIQLSPEELGQALKHLPDVSENEENAKSGESGETENSVQEAKPGNLEILLQKAEEIVFSGVNSIRNNIDKASETVSGTKPSPEAWAQLNQTLETFFRDQYKRVSLKEDKPPENQNNNENNSQNNQNNEFMQNLINGFQSIANNFLGNNFNQKPGGPEDEQQQQQQQNPFQTLVNMFTGGINQVVNNVNNLNGPNNSTGQEDSGTDGGSNFFGNVVHQIQQFFGGQGSTPSQSVNINQSDTGVQPPNNGQGGFIQGAINQFSQVVNNFRPSTSTSAPVQGDEGTLPSSTTQSSNFFQNIGQAVQNVNNVFRPQSSTTSPQGGGSNPITSGAQAIGGQFGQVIGGQGPAGGSGGSNPITSGAQAIGSQFGQLTGGQGGEGSGGSNPISSGAQAIGSQFGQLVGQGGAAGGGDGSAGSNPITSGAQAIGSQFQQLVGGQKPSESGSGSSSTEKSKADNSQAKDSVPPEAEHAEKPKDEKKAPEVMETTE